MLTLSGFFVALLMLGVTGQSLIGGVFLVEMIPSNKWSWLLGVVAVSLLGVHFLAYRGLWRAWFVDGSIGGVFLTFGYQVLGVVITFGCFFVIRHFFLPADTSGETVPKKVSSQKIDF